MRIIVAEGPASARCEGTSPYWLCLAANMQAAKLSPLRKRRGNHAVLGSSVSDRRSRRCRLGIWGDRWRVGWDRQNLVLHLSGPAFGLPGHPLHERIPHTLRRISHGEKILTERF
jgi:hypothetical protein